MNFNKSFTLIEPTTNKPVYFAIYSPTSNMPHICGYVEIPKELVPSYKPFWRHGEITGDYDNVNVNATEELTYAEFDYNPGKGEAPEEGMAVIGWDFAHYGDEDLSIGEAIERSLRCAKSIFSSL